MEKATEPGGKGTGGKGPRKVGRRRNKRAKLTIGATKIIEPAGIPEGAWFSRAMRTSSSRI